MTSHKRPTKKQDRHKKELLGRGKKQALRMNAEQTHNAQAGLKNMAGHYRTTVKANKSESKGAT